LPDAIAGGSFVPDHRGKTTRTLRSASAALGINAALLAGYLALASAPSNSVTPNPSVPGAATTIDVRCGSSATSAMLYGTTMGLSSRIPMHSASGTRTGEFIVRVKLPATIVPGTYRPTIDCSNGNSATVTVQVIPLPTHAHPRTTAARPPVPTRRWRPWELPRWILVH
jgi:hypothetical protein